MGARVGAALLLAMSACVFGAGCITEPAESGEAPNGDGDGDTQTDALSERQFAGSQLPDKTLALTFNDGPGERTSELADYLSANGIKAGFFINGMRVPGRQAAIDSVINRGHTLGNHTQHHLQLTKLSSAKLISEVTDTDAFIAEAQPQGPWLLRAPFGAWSASVAHSVNATPMKKYVGSIFWDIGGVLTTNAAADWDCWGKGVSIQRCGELYLQEIHRRGHGVVLMHDIHDKTIDMVKQILPTLIAEGYHFSAITDVPSVQRAIAAGPPTSDSQCTSSTLGHPVDANACVQSHGDQKWYRCSAGDWTASTGAADTKCTQRYPLAP